MIRILRKKATPAKPVSKSREWWNTIVFAVVAATLIRWTTVEAFVVPTPSMENTILVGEYLAVSKFHYGTRTTTTPLQIPLIHQKLPGTNIPSYLNWIELPSYRLPGISEVRHNDIVVFNVPPKRLNDGEDHPVNMKTNYVKRCIGLPGDMLSISEGVISINDQILVDPVGMKKSYLITANSRITERVLDKWDIDSDDIAFAGTQSNGAMSYMMYLTLSQADQLKRASFISSVELIRKTSGESDIFPATESTWNGDDYGPIVIPAQGMTIAINDSTLQRYGETITLYDNRSLILANGKLMHGNTTLDQYTFSQNYYFMMGDNRHNSLDSRYWGFVPEDHIVGKPLFIWFSWNSEGSILNKVRWDRLFTRLE